MDGLEATEISFASLDLMDRFDAEYFSKENLEIEKRLKQKKTRKFSSFGDFVASAFYPAATHLYTAGDVPFIRCVDCVNHPVISTLQDEQFERIPSEFLLENKSIDTLHGGDIAITKVGTPCYASIVYDYDEVALSRTVLGLKNIKQINPYYLLAFLRSSYGFNQLLRQRELTIQYQLTLHRVKRIDIFEPTAAFQEHVEALVKASHQQLEQSRVVYAEAENLLLDELGLRDWHPPEANISVKSLKESFGSTSRLDAEYYNPQYESLVTSLRTNFPIETIGSWGEGS